MRVPAFAAALVLAACSSSSSTPSAAGADGGKDASDAASGDQDSSSAADAANDGNDGGGGDAGGCGLAFYPSDSEPSCQLLLDKYCCDQEKACAGDAACKALVKCIDDCPAPRDQACIQACGTSGETQLDAIATCTKTPPYAVPPGLSCGWPQ